MKTLKHPPLLIVIAILVTVTIVLFFVYLPQKKGYLFIQDDSVFFGMTEKSLTNSKGKPLNIEHSLLNDSIDTYYYEEMIMGYTTTSAYSFCDSQLIELNINIPNIDYKSALRMVENIINKQEAHYSNDERYEYSEDVNDEILEFKISNGIDYGATGITFIYGFSNGTLQIYATKQE